MPKYLKHQQINKELWDKCVSESHNGIIYSYSWYLDIVCEGWDAVVNEDYSAVMPLPRGAKYLMKYIYPPFFTQQLGVFSKNQLSESDFRDFFTAIPSSFRFIEMNLDVTNQFVPPGFSAIKNSDFIVDLMSPYKDIRASYSENHTRNCTKASKNKLNLFKHANIELVVEMFLENRGRQITKLKPMHYEILKKLVKEALNRKMAQIWSISDPAGIPCAAAVFFESHNIAIFIFSAITSNGRNLSAMQFLIDQYILENSLQKKALDFEGSNDPDLARFYKGFGSTEFVYLQIKKNSLPPPWSWVKK